MRARPLPPSDDLLAHLREAGVEDAPTSGPDEDHLQGLLALALHVADCQKDIQFQDFSWADPKFVAKDARVEVRFVHARMRAADEAGVRETLLANMPRVQGGAQEGPTLLALDARPSGLAEFAFTHMLYGEVTLFEHRRRPHEPSDVRIHRAEESGWTPTLKAHNLLPGRGLVVLDEHHGLLLREPWLDDLVGILALFASGETTLLWNPFAKDADAQMQHWLSWGRGTGGPSEWREVLHVRRDDE